VGPSILCAEENEEGRSAGPPRAFPDAGYRLRAVYQDLGANSVGLAGDFAHREERLPKAFDIAVMATILVLRVKS